MAYFENRDKADAELARIKNAIDNQTVDTNDLESLCALAASVKWGGLMYSSKVILPIISSILNLRINPTKKGFLMLYNSELENQYTYTYNINSTLMNYAELLIAYGYQFTYEDFLVLVSNGYWIDNIERFQFKFDNRYLEACQKSHIYPVDPYTVGLAYTQACLHAACENGNETQIKTIHKTVPYDLTSLHMICKNSGVSKIVTDMLKTLELDVICIENLCLNANGNQSLILKLLEKYKIKPTLTSIKNVCQSSGSGKQIIIALIDAIEKN